ncbi:hypothetical protein ADH76_13530 [Enterocloster clostridioformis]|nr:hypothetical protein A4V08_21125 [Lachnoclostridium sp. YL32]OXE69354.1 hypothetical protein ADH76_13530 [Enterocloster clostridioformis]
MPYHIKPPKPPTNPEMESAYLENDRIILFKSIHEKEALYNQHKSVRIFGAGAELLKNAKIVS